MSGTPGTIHRYEIVERIGEGGMGALYLARDPVLDRQVAIKLLREGFDNPDLRERFVREAKSAARLTHVNIVRIFDFGEHEGQPFIAMEYIPGETLGDKIRRRAQIPLAERLRYMEELCAGLAHAHKAKIVHRDIKPANVMIAPEGPLKILDFGIARLGDSKMTQAGMLVGTLNYMSPEQLAGGAVDHRSDIFAVGAVFYELLAYRQAFPGGLHDGLLHRILHGAPEPIEKFCPDLEPELPRIILRAMEKDPARRFQSLSDMGREIARVRDWLPAEATGIIAPPEAATMAIPVPPLPARTPGPKPSGPSGSTPAPPASTPSARAQNPAPAKPPVLPERTPVPPANTQAPSSGASAADRTAPMPVAKRPRPPATDPAVRQQVRASEVQSLLETAEKALEQGRYAEAIGAAEAVLVRVPDHQAAAALAARARRQRQAALASAAAQAASAALASGHIEIAERHLAEAAAADPDHADVLKAHAKIKEARAAAEAERSRRLAEEAERERARLREAEEKRRAEEADREAEERRRREQDARRRQEEAEHAARREQEAQARRAAEASERDEQVAAQLRAAEAALGAGRPEDALAALERALGIDPNARVGALRVRTDALREELARAEAGRRQREREQRIAAARARVTALGGNRIVQATAAVSLLATAALFLVPPLLRDELPETPPQTTSAAAPPPAPARSADASVSGTPDRPVVTADPGAPAHVTEARALYAQGRRREALRALLEGDEPLREQASRSLADVWLADARLAVASAAQRALRSGASGTSAEYKAATSRRGAADDLRDRDRIADALQAYWQAQEMYEAIKPAPAAVPSPSATPEPARPETTATPPPTTAQPVAPPSDPAPVPPPQPKAEATPPPVQPSEREAVLRTVYGYAEAMSNRDMRAVSRMRRLDAQERRIVGDLRHLTAYNYQLTPTGPPAIEGDRATIRCVRQQTFVDARRRRNSANDTVVIDLVKQDGDWVIVEVRRVG